MFARIKDSPNEYIADDSGVIQHYENNNSVIESWNKYLANAKHMRTAFFINCTAIMQSAI